MGAELGDVGDRVVGENAGHLRNVGAQQFEPLRSRHQLEVKAALSTSSLKVSLSPYEARQ